MSNVLTLSYDKLSQDDKDRVMKAVDLLCKDNPDVAKQLEKLADIKINNPKQWSMGKKILKL
ncbi:hypothetical protein IQ13_3205 [Lacibacter cauensis]|uniref:Uncharacterized protein n=1 Tax=Lacibacter cauensis TaxID=510947 RepID=A0A562SGW5_9BACT|nr:hypothetical protein [Lacibacter cauensis]TWI80527.1 hypothetical protein IQ13_3205 [Lacibacter cauensis]